MVIFPNCKINLGLSVLNKRSDGYHNIESIFYPVNWLDTIEIVESEKDELIVHGNSVTENSEQNTCMKALCAVRKFHKIPAVQIHLLKFIPMGAGLGGGSADAAFTIKLLNQYFDLKMTSEIMKQIALSIGSDCPFFINNKPSLVGGRGELISEIQLTLKDYFIAIVKPEKHIETAKAYSLLKKKKGETGILKSLSDFVLSNKPEEWKGVLINDFEDAIFEMNPEIADWKTFFYRQGAAFSLMSGSGSSVYGIFRKGKNVVFPKNGKENIITHISDL